MERKADPAGQFDLFIPPWVVQDTTIILKREAERLAGEAEVAKDQARRMELVLGRITQAQEAASSASLDELQVGMCPHLWFWDALLHSELTLQHRLCVVQLAVPTR